MYIEDVRVDQKKIEEKMFENVPKVMKDIKPMIQML